MAGPTTDTFTISNVSYSGTILSMSIKNTTYGMKNPDFTIGSDSGNITTTRSGYLSNPYTLTVENITLTLGNSYSLSIDYMDNSDSGTAVSASGNFYVPIIEKKRVVQLIDNEGNKIYPVGADPNQNPTWFTMTQEGVSTTTTTKEYISPKGDKFYITIPVSEVTDPCTSYLRSTDYDLSKIKSYRQTLFVEVQNTTNNVVGLYDVANNIQYTRYMGSYLAGTVKTPYEASETARASGLPGFYWYNSAISLTTATSGLTYSVIVEATSTYINENKWMVTGSYSVNGFLTAGQFCMYITAPSGHLPLFTLPAMQTTTTKQLKRTVSLLLED